MATSSCTESVTCSAQPLGIDFHPSRDIVAAGLIDGTVELHDYSTLLSTRTPLVARRHSTDDDDEEDTILSSTAVTTNNGKSCRSVLFSQTDPNLLYTCGNDASFRGIYIDRAVSDDKDCFAWKMNTNKETSTTKVGINSMFAFPTTSSFSSLLVTGDDEGLVKLWDTRLCGNNNDTTRSACVATWNSLHKDFISGFACGNDGHTLLTSSGDCTLSALDVRQACGSSSHSSITNSEHPSIIKQSEDQEDELLSVVVIKNGRKVVCGTQDGVLHVFSWGQWADVSDRFPGHPHSIDTILKMDEDTIITGSSDGMLRVVQIHPDKLLGVMGDHDGFPIEELRFDRDRRVIGSVTHDEYVRLWDTSFMREYDDNDDGDENEDTATGADAMELMREAGVGLATTTSRMENDSDDDWEDMDEEDDLEEDNNNSNDGDANMIDSDDSDDDDNVGKMVGRGKKALKTEAEKFFEDL